MSKEQDLNKIRPLPPPTVNKELLGVWSGWSQIGNREVVREAVAKGVHIELAHTFLATRMKLESREVKNWFMEEVFLWVDELLQRKQVFRASHILNNIKLDPHRELTRLFLNSRDINIRDYLGDYLFKGGKLDEHVKEAWNLLRVIENNCKLMEDCDKRVVGEVIDAGEEWRKAIANRLFFKTFDKSLTPFLNSQNAWSLLLCENLNLLLSWINVFFTSNLDYDGLLNSSAESEYDVRTAFLNLPITEEMINSLDTKTNSKIMDELSKLGVFPYEEKCNAIRLLQRLRRTDRIIDIHEILSLPSCNTTSDEFMTSLTRYCMKHDIYSLLNWCNVPNGVLEKQECRTRNLDLILFLRQNTFGDMQSIGNNIQRMAKFLSRDFYLLYQNPLIGVAIIIFLYPQDDLIQMIEQRKTVIKGWRATAHFLKDLHFFHALLQNKQQQRKSVVLQNLKDAHFSEEILKLYRGNETLINFNSQELVAQFGFRKHVDLKFYLTEERPSMAVKEYLKATNQNFRIVLDKIVTKKFNEPTIVASCVSFCRCLNINPDHIQLRTHLASLILNNNTKTYSEIVQMLRTNQHNKLLKTAEKSWMKTLDFRDLNLKNIVNNGRLFGRFASITENLQPDGFLRSCGREGMWLLFLIYTQMNNYCLKQVQKLCSYFEGRIAEHLLRSISFDWQIEEQKNMLMRERDSRKYYLSRVGVRKSMDEGSDSSSTDSSRTSCSSDFSLPGIEPNEDVLQMIVKCHNSSDPPKALLRACYCYRYPFFAILATSYEPDSAAMNWLIWLSVACDIEDEFLSQESMLVSAKTVMKILQESLKKRRLQLLLESFCIFLPDNCLRYYIEFLNNSLDINYDPTCLHQQLKSFNRHVKRRKISSILPEMDYDFSCLENPSWLEKMAIHLTLTLIEYQFDCRRNQMWFLRVLDNLHIQQYFTVTTVPDFNKYYNIVKLLLSCDSSIKLNLSVINQPERMLSGIMECLEALQNQGHFAIALEIAKLERLDTDLIVVRQWREVKYPHFWIDADKAFAKEHINPDIATDFFLQCATVVDDHSDELEILKICYKWANLSKLTNVEVERKMWIAYMRSQRLDFGSNFESDLLYREIVLRLAKINGHCNDLSAEELKWLDKITEQLLINGHMYQALKLAKMFDYKHTELDALTLCCALAEGILMPYQLDANQRLLVTKGGNVRAYNRHRRNLLSGRFSSFSSGSHSLSTSTQITSISEQFDDFTPNTLEILDSLAGRFKYSQHIAQRVLLIYRISANIECKYHEVFLCTDSVALLRKALSDDCANKLEVINDVALVFKWSKEEIAHFLAGELITTISDQIVAKQETISIWDINLEADFHAVLQLLPENASHLGVKLYKYACTIYKSQAQLFADLKMSDLALIIELLIRAHDCFTSDCNMEGISMILRKCQEIINLFLSLKSWKFIVRLLIGVGRYTEMTYVFQMLKENDQFEFLLRKGNKKDNRFKVALLDYLKKYCPRDRELYMMVALHFALFSEIGQMWEDEARSIIRNLITISKLEMQNNGMNPDLCTFILFTNTDGTKICLNKAKINYTHATEYHLQGEKLSKAMFCAKQAELLALQLAILKNVPQNSTTTCLLNLNQLQIINLLSTELTFAQSLIIGNAYNQTPEWGIILFEQCVIRNNVTYLDHFLETLPITESIVKDIARKFLTLTAIESTGAKNMKRILNECPSLRLKYKVASELGFSDMVEDLLKGSELAYLKDTVWKKLV